jgi:hypothetical protein
MLPKFRSFARPIIRSSVRSFIVPIHRSFIVTIHCSVIRDYSSLLFIIVTIYRYYSSSLLFTDSIHHCYYSPMISTITFSLLLFIIAIHRYYSSIIRSPQISTSHPSCCPAHLRLARVPDQYSSHTNSVTVIFLPVRTFYLVTHPRFLQVEHA